MIGPTLFDSPRDVYVASCGEPFRSRASGLRHEKTCPNCHDAENSSAAEQGSGSEAHDILTQIGWWDEEKCFTSFRFTPDQLEAFEAACERHPGMSPEEVVASMCEATDVTGNQNGE